MFTFCVKTNDGGNLLGQAIMVVFIRNWYEQNPFFTTKNDVHSKDIDFYILLHQGQRWIINETIIIFTLFEIVEILVHNFNMYCAFDVSNSKKYLILCQV